MEVKLERIFEVVAAASLAKVASEWEAFAASATWTGPRAGFVFSTGPRGTGYYQDAREARQSLGCGRFRTLLANCNP